jgi:3-methyladenine DNA glycosylase AlkC
MHRVTEQIHAHLPVTYRQQIKILNKVAPNHSGLAGMLFPNFVEKYGMDDYDTSIEAIELYTQFSTSEFAIRPFITKAPERTMAKMLEWSLHENHHVRRLASEGCRPLLPWAMKLIDLNNDPSPIIPILENLNNDEEDYVYRSVANNLNDISKNHPDLVLNLCKKWLVNASKNTKWLVKHALRTLLKQGNQRAMQMFGFGDISKIKVNRFSIKQSKINIGEASQFNLNLINQGKTANFRMEYVIYYLKNNGKHNSKVFQIKETELKNEESVDICKKINFQNLSTRKHYAGQHFIALKINGKELNRVDFELFK